MDRMAYQAKSGKSKKIRAYSSKFGREGIRSARPASAALQWQWHYFPVWLCAGKLLAGLRSELHTFMLAVFLKPRATAIETRLPFK